MAFWEFECDGRWTGRKSAEELGIQTASFRAAHRQADNLSLRAGCDMLADPPILYGDRVRVYRDGALWYQGRCGPITTAGEVGQEYHQLELLGPWSELRAHPAAPPPPAVPLRRYDPVVRDQNGLPTEDRLTTGGWLAALVTAAAGAGVPIQSGTVPPGLEGYDFTAPGSFATGIEAVLDLHPDWVARMDYTTTPPTLHITEPATRETLTVPVNSRRTLHTLRVTRRTDLTPRAVTIVSLMGPGESAEALEEDPTITVLQMGPDKSVVSQTILIDADSLTPDVTINLLPKNGAAAQPGKTEFTWLSQRVKTRTYPQTAADAGAKEWWVDHIPTLHRLKGTLDLAQLVVAAADAEVDLGHGRKETIKAHSARLIDDGQPAPPNNVQLPPAPPAEPPPRELVEGQIEDWMQVVSAPVEVSASIGYKASVIAAIADGKLREEFRKMFPRTAQIGGTWYCFNTFSIRIQATSAKTKLYRAPASVTITPPTMPVDYATQSARLRGAALAWAQTMARSQWSGSVSWTTDECPADMMVGKALSLTGGRPEWAAMAAVIQSVDMDFDTGTTSISFGPPDHLGWKGELAELAVETPEPTTIQFDYSDSSEGSATGAYATAQENATADCPDRTMTGGATLSVHHAEWKNGVLEVYFSPAKLPETTYQAVTVHDIQGPNGVLDGETKIDFPADSDTTVWLTVETDEMGKIVSTPIPLTLTEPTAGTFEHFRPPSPDPETDDPRPGKYKFRLYRVVTYAVGSVARFYPLAPIPHWTRDGWHGRNIGEGDGLLYRRYTHHGKYDFRTLTHHPDSELATPPNKPSGYGDEISLVEIPAKVEIDTTTDTVRVKATAYSPIPAGATGELIIRSDNPALTYPDNIVGYVKSENGVVTEIFGDVLICCHPDLP